MASSSAEFRRRVAGLGIEEVLTAPRSPWQNSFAERLIGSTLDKDAPEPRQVSPPEAGVVVELPKVGGLHHRYERRLAA